VKNRKGEYGRDLSRKSSENRNLKSEDRYKHGYWGLVEEEKHVGEGEKGERMRISKRKVVNPEGPRY